MKKGGIIEFIRPEDCKIVKPIKKYKYKLFHMGENMQSADVLALEVK